MTNLFQKKKSAFPSPYSGSARAEKQNKKSIHHHTIYSNRCKIGIDYEQHISSRIYDLTACG